METTMSDLLDEYPIIISVLELLIPLGLLAFIIIWTTSGKKKAAREKRRQP